MKKLALFFFFAVISFAFTACSGENTPSDDVNAQNGFAKEWRIVAAKFGREVAEASMFENYRIQLNADGSYSVVNPDGFPSPSAGVSGNWLSNAVGSEITFDGTTAVTVVFFSPSGEMMTWEWDVRLPGKERTTYRFELEAVK
ncbi:hypothetical protein [Hugenholtzia roseola]|uniref:hypothetical protein n=1 Tax=Hugenholtzia roseola TaxID=1002 RepID=UPI00042097B0|nr:hypothetical protein [Hugenholtzia roseola]